VNSIDCSLLEKAHEASQASKVSYMTSRTTGFPPRSNIALPLALSGTIDFSPMMPVKGAT